MSADSMLRGQPFFSANRPSLRRQSSECRILSQRQADNNRPVSNPFEPVMPSTIIAAMVWPFHLNHFFNVADAFTMARFDFLPERAAITRIEHTNYTGMPSSTAQGIAKRSSNHRGAMMAAVAAIILSRPVTRQAIDGVTKLDPWV